MPHETNGWRIVEWLDCATDEEFEAYILALTQKPKELGKAATFRKTRNKQKRRREEWESAY
jgi:hypothetical protein